MSQALQDEFYDLFLLAQSEGRSEALLRKKKQELLECQKAIDKTLKVINLALAIKGEKNVGIKEKV